MKSVKLQRDGSIKLPKEITRRLPRSSELVVWKEGDTIVLKRMSSLRPSGIAERAPGKEMPLAKIAAEVHRMRREKRKRRG